MTLRHLRIFLAVKENHCNTTRAAEALHMTQPAVSLAIRELEEYYGVVLFDRVGRRLRLTEAGKRFGEYAGCILAMFDDMEKGMRNWDAFGLLRVGSSITIGSQFLPYYVNAFYARHPGTEVKVLVGPSDQLEQKLLAGELDLALIEGTVHSAGLVAQPYMEDSLSVICPAGGSFRPGQVLTVEEFRKQKFLLREHGSGTRDIFDLEMERAGIAVEPIWEGMSTTALVNAVINGLGIAVLPSRMVRGPLQRGIVVAVKVEGLEFRRQFHIVHHREKFLTASARAFIELCRSYEMDYPLPQFSGL